MKLRLAVLLCIGLFYPLMQTLAHHSFAAEYDEKKVMTIKGKLTRFE